MISVHMLYLFALFSALYLTAVYADHLTKKKKAQARVLKDPVANLNSQKDTLKAEFLGFFKDVYSSFSTGDLQDIEPKVSEGILVSLKSSIKERDDTNFTHSFKEEPSCEIRDIEVKDDNVVSIKAEFKSEQVISSANMDDITDNVVDFFVFEKKLDAKNPKNNDWKLVKMG